MSLLVKELKEKQWVLVRVKENTIKDTVSKFLKEQYQIENEDFNFSIDNGADIPDIAVNFSNEKIAEFFQDEEELCDRELIEAAINHELKLEGEYCGVIPDDDNSTEYMIVEIPKAKLL